MQKKIAVVLGVVLLVAGCRTVEPPAPPEAPRISSFTASKTRIASGEEVTLSFSTTGATKVEVFDDQGREVALTGSAGEGSGVVSPVRSAFYVLRATGAGGRDSAFVQIAVNEPLKDLFLIAVPQAITAGEQAQLLWGAPGASSVTLTTGAGMPQALTGTTGTVAVSPTTTQQYTLTAQGAAGTPPLTALAQVEVRPALLTATFDAPTGVKPGEALHFTWTTAGASRVTISERTFGQLTAVTAAADVANGTFEYTLPATLPNGIAVSDGLPLSFTISVGGSDTTSSRTFAAVVGELPAIEFFEAPTFVTTGAPFTVKWRTTNATQVSIVSGSLPIFTTLPREATRAAAGSVVLPAPSTATQYELIATNAFGAVAKQAFTVEPVAAPAITLFTVTPAAIGALGDAVTARWTTTNAARVIVRLENGPTLAVIDTVARVGSGNVALTLATGANLTLEAYNAAGDVVTLTRAVSFNGPAATVTPQPALRNANATLAWTLQPAAVTEVVGLPASLTDAGVVLPPQLASTNYLDLSTVATAKELDFIDPANGTVSFTAPDNFRFPLFGTMHSTFTIGVDGLMSVTGSLPTGANASLVPTSAPGSLMAPLWDDMVLVPTSSIRTAIQSSALGERVLVVEWSNMQLASDANSSLTFQVQLYETGQVSFLYKSLTGTLDSATVGLTQKASGVTQQYGFNNAAAAPTAGLELAFFSGHPADGTWAFTATATRRIEFFGRTATGLVPVSVEHRVFGAGDVAVSEVMPLPEPSVATTGQWIELRNNLTSPIDFEGLTVTSFASTPDGGYVIPPATIVPAGGYLVLGQSTNLADTGGAPVTQVLTDVTPLAVPDSVRVMLGGVALGSLSWDAGTTAASIQGPDRNLLVSTNTTVTCTRTTTFGDAGTIGTPGAANESCAPYTVVAIPGAFRPAPAGSAILTSLSADSAYGSSTLPVPFTYFGMPYTAFSLSVNGFITLGHTLTDYYTTNQTTLSTGTSPNGVIAPFWDDLVRKTGGQQAMWREVDRTIISFENYEPYLQSTSVLNFQIHLVDSTGVIEFHYGTISTTSTTQANVDRITGSSASIWIEKPDGTVAVPWGVDRTGAITPNSGLRFTPRTP